MPVLRHHSPLAFDVSAKVVICRGDHVLLLRRPNGRWDLPGGKVRVHEHVVEGLAREVREETGLALGPLSRLSTIRRTRSNGKRCVVVSFQSCAIDTSAIELSAEHEAFGYFGFDDVADLRLRAHHKQAVRHAFWALYPPAHQLTCLHSQMTAA
ncbi:MAG: NUDIX domain-containing protein [Pseudomonadota bacterium]